MTKSAKKERGKNECNEYASLFIWQKQSQKAKMDK
jgi:hypothetical protein